MESYGKLMEDFRRLWKVIESYGILWKVIECYGKLYLTEFLLHFPSFVEEMLSLLLGHPLSAPCQYFSDVVVVRYLLLLILQLSTFF